MTLKLFPIFSIFAICSLCSGQSFRLNPIISPEVHPDKRVTFRLRAPNAESVELSGQFQNVNRQMQQREDGIWTVTLGPIKPDLYPYHFEVDGIAMNDPNNQHLFPNEGFKASLLDVPSDEGSIYAQKDVPHGKVSYHFYDSEIVQENRSFIVYTPPGYERSDESYPVFYLVSGTTDTEETFFKVGKANFILDNLIAVGKAKPMIIVMPYGNMRVGTPRPHTPEAALMYDRFAEVLMQEIVPYVESNYRTINERSSRAIAGFSRGGGQSLFTGFKYIDDFAHIGSYSAYLTPEVFETYFGPLLSDPQKTSQRLETLWLGVGESDFLYKPAVDFMDYLEAKGIERETLITEGGHTWMNARHYLYETAQRFFQ
ncbi:alpha/beta hydrolase-fold protein [Pelagicoccus sp. SDUM812003]|uniref:esterase n=1 Tax=Pelagicoccus sp. SDUM812003 TaxID=3041267 RepID=UPI00280D3964|nr:alpha/beta hydrolase-fold protein [Pelagicoccus sp. SDUM812003]MDQ8203487.1 alpha/beta hydrolase-fold protein [Pelagicoccus sp. SDUM812003]